MEEETRQIVYEVTLEGTEESAEEVRNVRTEMEGLREQVAALKEEPLKVEAEGEEGKKDKGKEKRAVKQVSDMFASGLVQGIKSGDVRGAMENFGVQLASQAATSLVSTLAQSALSMIPGIGPLLGGLLGGLFQREGLVTRPTLALVGERDYGYLPAIC
jgi:hypothetical protein